MVVYDYPLARARHVRETGACHFILVSSMGAGPESRIFYSRVKGEVEQDLRKAGFDRLTLARPTLLLGDRDESRFGEDLARRLRFVMRGKRSEEHTSELQSRGHIVCRLLLEKKNQ